MSRPLRPEFASLAGITCLTRSAVGDIVAAGAVPNSRLAPPKVLPRAVRPLPICRVIIPGPIAFDAARGFADNHRPIPQPCSSGGAKAVSQPQVLIVGAGPTGLVLALWLARPGHRSA